MACLFQIDGVRLWSEIDSPDLRIDGRHAPGVAIAGGGAGEVVGVNEGRIEGATKLQGALIDFRGCRSIKVCAALQPSSRASAMDVHKRVNMVEQMRGDHACDTLGEIALWISGK